MNSSNNMRGGLHGRRGGAESGGKRLDRGQGGELSSQRSARGGIAGSGFGPLMLVQGTKKMLQDVSRVEIMDAFDRH